MTTSTPFRSPEADAALEPTSRSRAARIARGLVKSGKAEPAAVAIGDFLKLGCRSRRGEFYFIHAINGRIFRGAGLVHAEELSQVFAEAMARIG
jgi:hypothetical protein